MPAPNTPTITLNALRERLQLDPSIPPGKRSEWLSAIKRFCEICGRTPGEVLADPAVIRALQEKASWQLAGLTKKGWSNLKSRLTAALKAGGVRIHRRCRRNYVLSESWDAALQGMKPRDRRDLHRFAGWCSSLQIAPDQVDQPVFDRFLRFFREEMILTHPKERWHVHRRAWNRTFATSEDGSFPHIEDTEPPQWRGLPWAAFPKGLQEEVSAYKQAVTIGRKFKVGEEPLSPVTIEGYLMVLRTHLSRLVEDGASIEKFQCLAACLDLADIHRGLDLINDPDRADIDDAARPRLQRLCVTLLSIARYSHAPEAVQLQIESLLRQVRHSPDGMTEKNDQRLAQFECPKVQRRFMNLPRDVAARVIGSGKTTHAAALVMQNAALLALLQGLPMRIKNAAWFDLEKHLQRRPDGRWVIRIPRQEVKNKKDYHAELNAESSAVLERYVEIFRPVLAKHGGTHLFPGAKGSYKCPSYLSKQLSRFVRRELGLAFNAHLIRHWAAFSYLEANPGDYETVRQLLNHKSINTTIKFYARSTTKAAHHRYDAMLAELREGDVHPDDLDDWDEL